MNSLSQDSRGSGGAAHACPEPVEGRGGTGECPPRFISISGAEERSRAAPRPPSHWTQNHGHNPRVLASPRPNPTSQRVPTTLGDASGLPGQRTILSNRVARLLVQRPWTGRTRAGSKSAKQAGRTQSSSSLTSRETPAPTGHRTVYVNNLADGYRTSESERHISW